MKGFRLFVVVLTLVPQAAGAQRAYSVLQAAPEKTGGAAFVVEALGATAGSLAGFSLIYLTNKDDCDPEDLECTLETGALALATSTVGAAVGNILAGNAAHTRPSGWGAAIGAIAGSVAGIGTWHLFTEEINVSDSAAFAIAVYAVTQGIVTALGSRIGAALR